MKIRQDDYTRLSELILHVINHNKIQAKTNYNITMTRYIWDIFHTTCDYYQYKNISDYLFIRRLYDYLNDSHMNTALKKILKDYL